MEKQGISMRKALKCLMLTTILTIAFLSYAQAAGVKLRLAASASATDARAITMEEVFAPAVADFATYEGHYGSSLFKQGTELEAISRGNLEMTIASAQELAEFFPEFSIFAAGYVHRDAAHQKAVFNADFMQPLKQKVEDELGVKLLAVSYLGKRVLNMRTPDAIMTPEALKGAKLRMPGSEAWLFLGKALGANPAPVPYAETYTALQTGAVDGQDNPLPNTVSMKFYEVTKSITLTNHLVDLNYLAVSKKVWNNLSDKDKGKLQAAADKTADAISAAIQEKESSLRTFLEGEGLKFHEPNLDAFRTRVQKAYLESDYAKNWVPGMLDKINAL
ncbi:MAG: C4-dicarboxylate ABC transporter [Desulfuromonas sp.]|nr:MAG: C4-dicarboxylate ABC transporter [Desulfuromonas sp.]